MITPRQYLSDDPYDSWWWSPAGYIVKWSIIAAILIIFLGWIIGGRIHAKRRIKRGLPPLAYHRWLVPRSLRAGYYPQQPQNQFSFYQAQQQPHGYGRPQYEFGGAYRMQEFAEPPPVYNNDKPPTYQPPPGATKAHPDQAYSAPPQTHVGPSGAGSSA